MTIQFLERVAFTSLPPRKKRRSEMDQAEGYTATRLLTAIIDIYMYP